MQTVASLQLSSELRHFLTGEELSAHLIEKLLLKALVLKKDRLQNPFKNKLQGQHLALLFDKPSLRTRMSFTIAMRELGGDVVESVDTTRKAETPEDQAQVLSGYCHAMMVRTYHDSDLQRMAKVARIPVINGLSNLHHPCQVLSDLLTLLETFNTLHGTTVSYVGDGNNVLHSLLLLMPPLGVNVHYCCPTKRGPDPEILARSQMRLNPQSGKIREYTTPAEAVVKAHAVYTDVWTSMGFEHNTAEHLFSGYQVNEKLMQHALPHAVFMHCLPMQRNKEVSATLADSPRSVIFQQSENRLHMQKALLLHLLTEKNL